MAQKYPTLRAQLIPQAVKPDVSFLCAFGCVVGILCPIASSRVQDGKREKGVEDRCGDHGRSWVSSSWPVFLTNGFESVSESLKLTYVPDRPESLPCEDYSQIKICPGAHCWCGAHTCRDLSSGTQPCRPTSNCSPLQIQWRLARGKTEAKPDIGAARLKF